MESGEAPHWIILLQNLSVLDGAGISILSAFRLEIAVWRLVHVVGQENDLIMGVDGPACTVPEGNPYEPDLY